MSVDGGKTESKVWCLYDIEHEQFWSCGDDDITDTSLADWGDKLVLLLGLNALENPKTLAEALSRYNINSDEDALILVPLIRSYEGGPNGIPNFEEAIEIGEILV